MNITLSETLKTSLLAPRLNKKVTGFPVHGTIRERSGSVVECLTRDRGATGKKKLFKHGHVAYQIDGDGEQNRMQVLLSS